MAITKEERDHVIALLKKCSDHIYRDASDYHRSTQREDMDAVRAAVALGYAAHVLTMYIDRCDIPF